MSVCPAPQRKKLPPQSPTPNPHPLKLRPLVVSSISSRGFARRTQDMFSHKLQGTRQSKKSSKQGLIHQYDPEDKSRGHTEESSVVAGDWVQGKRGHFLMFLRGELQESRCFC